MASSLSGKSPPITAGATDELPSAVVGPARRASASSLPRVGRGELKLIGTKMANNLLAKLRWHMVGTKINASARDLMTFSAY
jgi:hypothetical protein